MQRSVLQAAALIPCKPHPPDIDTHGLQALSLQALVEKRSVHVSDCVLAVGCTHLHRKAARVDRLLACAHGLVRLSEESNFNVGGVFLQVARASIICSCSDCNCTHL